jgi:uncharacterized membrane protein
MNDNRDYIIKAENGVGDERAMGGLINILLVLFGLCVVGVVFTGPVNDAWTAIEPYYQAVVEWRNGVVAWFQSVFG